MYLVEGQHWNKSGLNLYWEPKFIWDEQYIGSQKHQVLFLIFLKIDFGALSLTVFENISFSGQMRVMVPTM